MGQRITQRIYECSQCEKKPMDGEHLWYMGAEIWCKECIEAEESEQSCLDKPIELENESK
jgi:hypothetical protein